MRHLVCKVSGKSWGFHVKKKKIQESNILQDVKSRLTQFHKFSNNVHLLVRFTCHILIVAFVTVYSTLSLLSGGSSRGIWLLLQRFGTDYFREMVNSRPCSVKIRSSWLYCFLHFNALYFQCSHSLYLPEASYARKLRSILRTQIRCKLILRLTFSKADRPMNHQLVPSRHCLSYHKI